jgi:predicted acetyltransferase
MQHQRKFGPLSNEKEAENLGLMLCHSFNFTGWELFRDRIGIKNYRAIWQGNQIIGGLGLYPMAQWWGGNPVTMAGIAAVGVSPEHRGTGVAEELLRHTLQEIYKNQIPLSVLYPATQVLYRKVGYEQAGSLCKWQLPIQSIQMRDRTLTMHPVEPILSETIAALYQQQAVTCNGNLDRHPGIWENIFKPIPEEPLYADLIGEPDDWQGYIIYSQRREGNSQTLAIADWVALTPGAIRRLWTFIADFRSQFANVIWRSSPIDPFLLTLPEQTGQITEFSHWMLRIIDVPLSLQQRGYPLGIEAELHIEVQDNILSENNGKFILTVSNGKGEVTPGGRGDLSLDVRGLTLLYTGFLTPHQLHLSGHIQGNPSALSIATQLFSGPHPWMADMF